MENMICLLFVSSLYVICKGEFTDTGIQCDASMDGIIVSGNVCRFSCCLANRLRQMQKSTDGNHSLQKRGMILRDVLSRRRISDTSKCASFPDSGISCMDSGYEFKHKTVIKYNSKGCYICNNGVHYYYADVYPGASIAGAGDGGYTLVRFG